MNEMTEIRRVVGTNVRTLRKARGWTQEELGEHANVSYKSLGEIERGIVNPSLSSLLKVANALKVQIAELFLNDKIIVLTETEIGEVESSMTVLRNVLTSCKSRDAAR